MREPNYYTAFAKNVNDFFSFLRKILTFLFFAATKFRVWQEIVLEKRVYMCYDG